MDAFDAGDGAIDFVGGVVEVKAHARGGGDAEGFHEGGGAVVATADGDAVIVHEFGDVVGVDALHGP